MWRRKSDSAREVLCLGRVAAERWAEGAGGLNRVAAQPFATGARDRAAPVVDAIKALFVEPGKAPVTVLLESAWVPLVLAPTGGVVWRRPDVEALLRHRFALLHDDPADPVSEWDVRTDHVLGEPWALGYGFSPRLRAVLADAARVTGCEWAALMPAWSWGCQRAVSQRRGPGRNGHWAWREQDRMLLGSFSNGRLVALDPANPLCDTTSALRQSVVVHCVRHGLQASSWPVVVDGLGAAAASRVEAAA